MAHHFVTRGRAGVFLKLIGTIAPCVIGATDVSADVVDLLGVTVTAQRPRFEDLSWMNSGGSGGLHGGGMGGIGMSGIG
ncbi:MAG: hypothetical protein LBL59_12120, partial [Xanthomonadaceae bacterium]|nr:hypothetical protein [Xanthomonadaceae bacterium]